VTAPAHDGDATAAPDGPSAAALVEVGRVGRAHALRGEVVVHLSSDVPDRLAPGTPVRVGWRDTEVVSVREHQGRPLVRFAHVGDRSAAEALRGAAVEAAPLAPEDLDVYLAAELVGRPVVDADGVDLGTVTALVPMPAVAGYDLLEVRRADGSTWLLPAADELVTVEQAADGTVARLVAHDLPDGLADPTAAEEAR
jgi:16S rRNA processing protein RimM